jgi:hypothetical protein
MSTAAVKTSRPPQQAPSLLLLQERTPNDSQPKPVKFDAAFIERRMKEHRQLQERMALELGAGIIREVLALDGTQ